MCGRFADHWAQASESGRGKQITAVRWLTKRIFDWVVAAN
jgi:hypothetical protein